MNKRAVISKVSELKMYDRILPGSLLGMVTAAESMTVKSSSPADQDKFAVTFFNLGTLFLHKNTLVEIIPAYDDNEDEATDADAD